jgi:branched-chain amino acid transport system ATP-binding protein
VAKKKPLPLVKRKNRPKETEQKTAMLKVEGLEVVYHSVVLVLRGVSLEVPTGGIVALLGPNGAGKTTTLRAISGLLDIHDGRISKGEIKLGGDSILRKKPEEIVRFGVAQALEGRRIFPTLTVEENLRAGAWGQGRQAVKEGLEQAYDRFGVLADRKLQSAGFLSGGEQQMLALARALMSRPKLLLLDEPSLGLAPRVVRQVAQIISDIHESGVSVLLVEQNAEMALELADHGYIVENGKVVFDGPSDVLKADRDIQEFYLGLGGGEQGSYREVKRYRRRKRWLS